jgi:hypothetical protein
MRIAVLVAAALVSGGCGDGDAASAPSRSDERVETAPVATIPQADPPAEPGAVVPGSVDGRRNAETPLEQAFAAELTASRVPS